MGGVFRNDPPNWNCHVRVGCNVRTSHELPHWLKLPYKSGLQWAAMGGLFRNYPPEWNCHVRVGWNGLQWQEFSGITPPPLTANAMWEWAAMCCNERTFQELPPGLKLPCKSGMQWAAMAGLFRNYPPEWNCHVRVGWNGLQWQDFSGFTPWLKLPCKSELQWEDFSSGFTPWLKFPWKSGLQWEEFSGIIPLTEIAMYEWAARGCNRRTFHQDLPTDWNCHVRVGCNGSTFQELPPDWNCHIKWAAMGCSGRTFQELSPPDWNCYVRVVCYVLQWEDFWGITPVTEIAM